MHIVNVPNSMICWSETYQLMNVDEWARGKENKWKRLDEEKNVRNRWKLCAEWILCCAIANSIVSVIILAILIAMTTVPLTIIFMRLFMLLRTILFLFTLFILNICSIRTVVGAVVRIIWNERNESAWIWCFHKLWVYRCMRSCWMNICLRLILPISLSYKT